jgi:hypothetical protein
VQQITELNPESPENVRLTDTLMRSFDKRSKYTFYDIRLEEMPGYLTEAKDFLRLAQ